MWESPRGSRGESTIHPSFRDESDPDGELVVLPAWSKYSSGTKRAPTSCAQTLLQMVPGMLPHIPEKGQAHASSAGGAGQERRSM